MDKSITAATPILVARAALLLALAFVAQSIRVFIPVPPPFSMFLIGSLINMILLIAQRFVGTKSAALMGALLPVTAFAQGQLPVIAFVPLVAASNIIWVVLGGWWWRRRNLLLILPVIKMLLLYMGAFLVGRMLVISDIVMEMILFTMSWPQLFTGWLGIWAAFFITQKLSNKIN